jgi:hypothetical protein
VTLVISKFRKDSPKETREKLCEVDFTFDTTTRSYAAGFDGIDIPGEARMSIQVTCTEPAAYFSMAVLQGGNNIINIAAALKNYAHAMIYLASGYYLEIQIERERLQKAGA